MVKIARRTTGPHLHPIFFSWLLSRRWLAAIAEAVHEDKVAGKQAGFDFAVCSIEVWGGEGWGGV